MPGSLDTASQVERASAVYAALVFIRSVLPLLDAIRQFEQLIDEIEKEEL